MGKPMPAEERFDNYAMPEPNTGCWLWTGTVLDKRVYVEGHIQSPNLRPYLKVGRKMVLAYRFSYDRFVGPIPEGKLICHRCFQSLCVNPAHLYAGTHAENVADCLSAGRHPSQRYPDLVKEWGRKGGSLSRPPKSCPARSKIDQTKLDDIRARIAAGASWSTLAREQGVVRSSLMQMLRRDAARRGLPVAWVKP